MNRPTALIAEDELPQRQELRAMLADLWPELDVVAECADGLSALEALETHRPQFAFLDIRMPGVSGLEVARAAGARCHVIFTTAYEEYALRAFDEAAVDYLLKPIARDRLRLTIDRARARLSAASSVDITTLLNALQAHRSGTGAADAKQSIKWITASAGNTTKMYPIEEVLFFQAQDKYTRVVTASEEGYIRTSLRELLAALDAETFWQVHRSVVVRAGAIRTLERSDDGKLHLTLRGRSETLPVSSAFQYRFRGM